MSIRPFLETEWAANHCQLEYEGSSSTRTGALQVVPPSVLLMKLTSSGSPAATDAATYTFPRVGPDELSTAMLACPRRPPGFGPAPSSIFPPRFTRKPVKVGVAAG